MTSEEAKMLLSVRRPSGVDDDLPEVAEALAMAAADPELGAWLAGEEAFDSTISARLQEHEIPAELKAGILARMHEAKSNGSRKFTRRAFWWSASAAAAAAVAGVLFQRPGASYPLVAHFRTQMLDYFNHQFADQFDLVEPDPSMVRKWLQERPQAIAFHPPGRLPEGKSLGCKIIPWNNTSVTLVCYMPPDSPLPVHVFAVGNAALAAAGPINPEFSAEAGWNTSLWNGGAHTFLAISRLPETVLASFLEA